MKNLQKIEGNLLKDFYPINLDFSKKDDCNKENSSLNKRNILLQIIMYKQIYLHNVIYIM